MREILKAKIVEKVSKVEVVRKVPGLVKTVSTGLVKRKITFFQREVIGSVRVRNSQKSISKKKEIKVTRIKNYQRKESNLENLFKTKGKKIS